MTEKLSPEEKAKRSKERKERYAQEKAERERLMQEFSGTTVGPSPEFQIDMQVEDVHIPTQSLKERLFSRLYKDEEEDDGKKKTPKEKQQEEKTEKIISHTVPMTLAALLAVYSRRLFSERFKPCAPDRDEVASVLLPIFSIIARHVSVEGKASQDAIDIAKALLASITVATRMLITAEMIRSENSAGKQQSTTDTRVSDREFWNGSSTDTGRSYQVESDGIVSNYQGNDATTKQWRRTGIAFNGNGDAGNVAVDDRTYEANKVADLLHRDTQGRRAMGLAPRPISSEN